VRWGNQEGKEEVEVGPEEVIYWAGTPGTPGTPRDTTHHSREDKAGGG